MKIKRYNNLYQIIFLPHVFPINCFIIEQEKSLICIDMGVDKFADSVEAITHQTGKPVSKLILTHAHGDHVNGVPYFKEVFPEVPVGISERDSYPLKRDFTLLENEADKRIKGGFPKKDIPVCEEDTIDSLEVISTPGHTPGSVSFFEREQQMIIVGDAFQTRSGIAVSGVLKWLFPFPKMATWDNETAVQSAKKLVACKPKLLAVGHGNILIEPEEQMKEAIKIAEAEVRK